MRSTDDQRQGEFRFSRAAAAPAPSRLRAVLTRAARPGVISFAIGFPAEDLFPVRELAAAQARVLPSTPAALQYGVPYPPLRRQIVELMALRGVTCEIDQVFLTSGSQQGMDLLARLFLDDGDAVMLEETVFEGIRLAVERHGGRLLTVPTDMATGMEVAAVEERLAGGARPRFLYSIPSGHNPLGVSLSPEKRRRLATLARERKIPVIEDDAYGFLYYDDAPAPPLRALEERWVLYLGSFSKTLAPALRVGWLVVPPELVPRLSTLKHGTDLDTPSLSHRIVSAYLETGTLMDDLARKRAEYRRRRDLMLARLAAEMPPGVAWTRPASGLFVWLELPRGLDAATLLESAIDGAKGEAVAFSPGAAFAVGGGSHADHCLRLCFTSCPPDQIEEGVRRLARVIERALEELPRGSR